MRDPVGRTAGNIRTYARAAGCVALVAIGLLAARPAAAQTEPASGPLKWGPFLDLDGKVGTKRNLGEGDLFMPMLQDSTSMLFADIRGRFDDHSDDEGNFGLGIRHMLEAGWNLGAYGYYDRRKTELGSTFGQATFGAEALSVDWDLRANLYQPVGPSLKNVSTATSSSSATSTSSTTSSSAALSGTTVDVTTTTTTTTSTTTSTTTQTTQDVEQKGFDAEIGWRVPVFAAVDTTQLRVYAGGYRFYANGTNATQGPRGRIDLTIDQVPHLWEGARLEVGTTVQNDGPRGTQAFAEARLRIPLQIFGKPSAELTAIERRMEDPIVRDVDIVSQPHTASTSSTTSSSSSSSSDLVETATATSGGSAFTILNSGSTSGNSLATAITNAGSNATIILSGTFNVSTGNGINTGFNQTIESGAIGVRTASGHTATLNTSASIIGTNVASNGNSLITVQAGTALKGLTITDNFSGGTAGQTVLIAGTATGVNISNNTITVTQSGNAVGNALAFQNSNTGTVSGNTLTATGSGSATTMTALIANQSTTTITVSGNTMSASGGTTNDIVQSGANFNSGSTGNVRGSGVCSGTAASGAVSFTNGTSC